MPSAVILKELCRHLSKLLLNIAKTLSTNCRIDTRTFWESSFRLLGSCAIDALLERRYGSSLCLLYTLLSPEHSRSEFNAKFASSALALSLYSTIRKALRAFIDTFGEFTLAFGLFWLADKVYAGPHSHTNNHRTELGSAAF